VRDRKPAVVEPVREQHVSSEAIRKRQALDVPILSTGYDQVRLRVRSHLGRDNARNLIDSGQIRDLLPNDQRFADVAADCDLDVVQVRRKAEREGAPAEAGEVVDLDLTRGQALCVRRWT
jgi:hypothetical protein